ncbi:hypothetical protein LINGRAHAP2_LOCUS26375 [Linum grandiflorum]
MAVYSIKLMICSITNAELRAVAFAPELV